MRLSLILPALLALMLGACATTAGDTPQGVAQAPGTAEEASCAAAGGAMQALGRLQRVQCVVPYADAGKACSNKSDCNGQCLGSGDVVAGAPATGVCQRDASENFGCRQRIDGGVAQGTICVD